MHWHVYFWHNIMYFLFQVTYFMNSTNFGSQKNQPALWSLTFIRNDLWRKCEIRSRTEMLFYDWTITVTTQIVFRRFRYDAYRSRLFQYRQHSTWHRIDCGKRAWAFTLSPITLVPSTPSPATWRTAGATDSQQYTLHMLVPPWTLLSSLYNEKMHFLRCYYMYTVSFRPIEVNIQDADAFHLVSLRRPSAFLIPVSVHPS